MPRFDQTNAQCLVYTFKEGLLAPVAHDLQLRVTRFWLKVGDKVGDGIAAEFDPRSLQVVAAMNNGQPAPNALSDADKLKIAKLIEDEVLAARRHPTISFQSSQLTSRAAGGFWVRGELTLCGRSKTIEAQSRLEGSAQVVEVDVHQPDFGIAPYRAMMGTLKVKATVKVRLSFPNLSQP